MKTLKEILIAEATEYEFKSELEVKKPKSWLKTVSAFANGLGGSIYFGVEDNGSVIGLSDVKQTADTISNFIKTKIEPGITFILEPIQEGTFSVLRLNVDSGAAPPYFYSSDGNKIAYVRLGNESVQAPSNMMTELILKGSRRSFDALESEFEFSKEGFTYFSAAYRHQTGLDLELPKDFKSFGLMLENGNLTYAGAMVADHSLVYQSRIFCTRWNGLTKGSVFEDATDDKELSGNVLTLLENAKNFIQNNSKVKWRKTGHGRIDMPDYPQTAVHEAVVNAIIHRDYAIRGSEIHIDIYDDRLEIVSPGGMMDGFRIQGLDIGDVASIRRNPVLCDLFHRLKFMERRGSGLKKIRDAYTQELAPEFRSTPQVFIVTLKNNNYPNFVTDKTKNVGDKIEKRYQRIIELVKQDGTITASGLAAEIKVSERTILRDLMALRNFGRIDRNGADSTGNWVVIE